MYSPETCILVPQRINEIFHYRPKDNGLPSGIRQTKTNKYSANYRGNSLGTYKTLEEAYRVYSNEKEKHIKEVAEEYKKVIPVKLYNALYDYKVDINNDRNYGTENN